MKFYIETKDQEVTRKEIRKHINVSLPKDWLPEHIIEFGITPITEAPKPETTVFQVATKAGTEPNEDGTRHRVWETSDRFQDIPDGATKAEQEAEYLAGEFEIAKTRKQRKINDLFNKEIATIKGVVEQGEVDTFDSQKEEALAYQADNTAETPLLSGLATLRGLTVDELAVRVLGHAADYKVAIAQVMGKKHVFEDQLAGAVTLEDLELIIVEQEPLNG